MGLFELLMHWGCPTTATLQKINKAMVEWCIDIVFIDDLRINMVMFQSYIFDIELI